MAVKEDICVLIVDDSPLIRQVIKRILDREKVIGKIDVAPNGKLALRKIEKLDPDVVTLDIEMPEMDGLETLRRIMSKCPRPVIMFSAHTTRGAEKTIKALELGAVDFIAKPSGRLSKDIQEVGEELVDKIIAVCSPSRKRALKRKANEQPRATSGALRPEEKQKNTVRPQKIVAIGASTGGTEAIRKVLAGLPADFSAGVVVVQHMPEGFTRSFAERLNEICPIAVKEAADRDLILPGRVLLAPGHSHMTVVRGEYGDFAKLGRGPEVNGHRPSVDVMLNSVAQYYAGAAIGVLLTGMGRDGASGMRRMFDEGALTIAQDENSSIVYGMPKVALDEGAVRIVADIDNIAALIVKNAHVRQRRADGGKSAAIVHESNNRK